MNGGAIQNYFNQGNRLSPMCSGRVQENTPPLKMTGIQPVAVFRVVEQEVGAVLEARKESGETQTEGEVDHLQSRVGLILLSSNLPIREEGMVAKADSTTAAARRRTSQSSLKGVYTFTLHAVSKQSWNLPFSALRAVKRRAAVFLQIAWRTR